jgi:hypothetical protein
MDEKTDLTGKLVRWDCDGQWLTARVEGTGTRRGSWRGEVVDGGNFTGLSPFATKQALRAGDFVPNLRSELLTVIDEGGRGPDKLRGGR